MYGSETILSDQQFWVPEYADAVIPNAKQVYAYIWLMNIYTCGRSVYGYLLPTLPVAKL